MIAVVPGLWTSMIIFFFAYLITNGVALYRRDSGDSHSDPNKVGKRKAQALTSVILTAILGLVFLGMRYRLSGCDTLLGLGVAAMVFGYFGYAWYLTLSSVGEDRLSDLFGIANRLLDPNSTADQPVGCVPIPKDGGDGR